MSFAKISPLPHRPSALSFEELFALFDAIGTVAQIVSGLACQPRFGAPGRDHVSNKAGDVLDGVLDHLWAIRDAIREEAAARLPANARDAERKFYFLVCDYIDGLSSPDAVLKAVTSAVTAVDAKGVAQ